MSKEQEFTPIRVSTLRGDLKLSFNLFIRVAGKHILYCREGESFEGSRLQRLKVKKIRQLFIMQDSESQYRQYLEQNINSAFDPKSDRPIEARAQIAHGLQQASTEEMMENPKSEGQFKIFCQDTSRHILFLLRENEALRAILNVENTNQSIAHHGVNVASLNIAVAQTLGISDSNKIEILALGGLLHDIEHHHSGLDVAKSLTEFSDEEKKTYFEHPDLGADRVQHTGFYPQGVLKIIRQHHETIGGNGFPSNLRETELDDTTMITSVSDAYDRLISYQGHEQKSALKALMMEKVGALKLEYIQALGQMLKSKGIS